MDKERVAEALRVLGQSESRPETARLREIFPDIEAAIASGVSRSSILETLHSHGFKMTPKSFESALYRLRKKATKDATPQLPNFPFGNPTAPASNTAGQEKTEKAKETELQDSPLNAQQIREKRASHFITPETTNLLVKRALESKDKK